MPHLKIATVNRENHNVGITFVLSLPIIHEYKLTGKKIGNVMFAIVIYCKQFQNKIITDYIKLSLGSTFLGGGETSNIFKSHTDKLFD